MAALEATSLEVLPWLKTLPLAPEYHPTAEEFRDPIAYILKIEDEASRYGICKIVPPVPPPSKKAAAANLARSLAEGVGAKQQQPMFTTRQQQIGFCPRKSRPVQKPVWQSGEAYTLPQFEAKAKAFERAQLKKVGKKSVSPLEMETMFWKACADKPFSVEYANDMPGSAFVARGSGGGGGGGESLAETAWNMRGISRSKMSLLKFMKEEIPGVTSPMVYVAMMFSWFAWHVEDHDLHSLNYLHLGAGKTWYGVPRDAAVAFEEVVRVHGYGDEVNPLVTYAILGEKTTVMSPEVLIAAGVPCCRLVQNAGEFVVTFPRAYHSGFSHGFNCGEASNIATPGWLRVAKEAAIRRACISYPPMLSHFQLLYNLVLALCSSMPKNFGSEPRSSRLKDKKRGEGEMVVKQLFVEDMIQNNERLHILLKRGSSCILLPPDSFELPLSSNSRSPLGCKIKVKSRLPLGSCSRQEPIGASNNFLCNDVMPERNPHRKSGFWSASGSSCLRLCEGKQVPSVKYSQSSSTDLYSSTVDAKNVNSGEGNTIHGDGLFDQGLLSCVTCGLLSFACVAVIQPSEAAAKHIMSTTCSVFNDDIVGSVIDYDQTPGSSGSGQIEKDTNDGLVDIVVQSGGYHLGVSSERAILAYDTRDDEGTSALDLLASAYGDSSDSDEELYEHKISTAVCNDGSAPRSFTSKSTHLGSSTDEDMEFISYESDHYDELSNLTNDDSRKAPSLIDPFNLDGAGRNLMVIPVGVSHPREVLWRESLGKFNSFDETSGAFKCDSKMSSELHPEELSRMSIMDTSIKNQVVPLCQTSNRDVSRMHVFCLEHAVEVERQLRPIGGGDVLLICHPDYLKVERRAKSLAKELAINCCWKDIHFREATAEDKEKIQTAIDDEEAMPGNGDWAVKLGINLYYSSSLCRSPLYSKQMPYNEVIYRLFGQDPPQNSPTKLKVYSSKRSRKQKKVVVAGKWCGKVWMSNQVHPSLVHRDTEEQDPSKESRYNSDSADENREEVDDLFTSETPPAEKLARKRKNPFEIVTTKKLKHEQSVDAISSEEDIPVKPSRVGKRIVHSGAVKRSMPVQIERNKRTITSARKFDMEDETEDGPCTRLRKRPSKSKGIQAKPPKVDKEVKKKKPKKFANNTDNKLSTTLEKDEDAEYQCDMEGCSMCFSTKQDLVLHKKNICLVKGCGKKFFSHKYLVQHRRVHLDDRPLKCPWKGCKMTFKWAWARTEHVRVHTGARPYVCKEPGCGQTFRFVSDFSRHKRKTGHSLKKKGRG